MSTGVYERRPIRERFEEKYIPEPNTGCWLWIGCRLKTGYGKIGVNKKHMLAHRFSYEFNIGPIADGLTIDHLCRNTSCVNPDHLEAVTQKENIKRSSSAQKLRERIAAMTHCRRGHSLAEAYVWISKKRKTSSRQCRICHAISASLRVAAKGIS